MSKNKYPSKYSNGKTVSAAQYITEIICEKRAKMNKEDLHYRFWTTKKWASYYKNQIASAHKLLSKYSDIAIVKALNSKGAEKIYSLRAPHLVAMIEQEQNLVDNRNQNLSITIDRKENKVYRKSEQDKNSIISKLKDIDYES